MNGLAGWHPNPSRPAARRDKRYRTGARPVAGAGYNITVCVALSWRVGSDIHMDVLSALVL